MGTGIIVLALEGPELSIRLALIGVFIILSGFFSASEIAFSSLNIVRVRVYVEEGKKGSRKALKLAEDFNKTLPTLLVGNNIVNIGMAVIATVIFVDVANGNQQIGELFSTFAITIIVLIFGEVLPKSFAKNHPEAFALKVSSILLIIGYIFLPLSYGFYLLQKVFNGKGNESPTVTEGELEAILDTMNQEGVIESDESRLIKSVLDLNDKTVEDIMIPRIDMIAIPIDEDVNKVKKSFFEHKFSRIPVYQEDKDDIVGILYERDFFTKLIKNQKINFKQLARPVKYVSKSMKVDDLIHDLQRAKMHIAVVSGEYGETAGIVTMEDALEQLVGEIYDEHDDIEEEPMIKISDTEYQLDGTLELNELFELLSIGKAPVNEEHTRLSAWLYALGNDVPKVGDQMLYSSDYISKNEGNDYVDYKKTLTFTIEEVEERRIKKINLSIEDVQEIKEN